MTNTVNSPFVVGSVISGTLRPQDLIPAFLNTVRDVAPAEYEQLMANPFFPPIPSYVCDEGDSSEWWDSEDASSLMEDLVSILQYAAPDLILFGTHPGDGADWGFWPDWEEIEGLEAEGDLCSVPSHRVTEQQCACDYVLLSEPSGSTTLYEYQRNSGQWSVLWSTEARAPALSVRRDPLGHIKPNHPPAAADIPEGTPKGMLAARVYPDVTYDTALPQGWVDACLNLGFDPRPCFVWGYPDGSIFGMPLPVTQEGAQGLPAEMI